MSLAAQFHAIIVRCDGDRIIGMQVTVFLDEPYDTIIPAVGIHGVRKVASAELMIEDGHCDARANGLSACVGITDFLDRAAGAIAPDRITLLLVQFANHLKTEHQ